MYVNPQLNERITDFDSITIHLASPESILRKSYGEVLKPETINYRSYKPEKDGLFCEKIFGPVKDWECHCGKYKRIRYKGIICDRCGVEVTRKKVRRERMGHITLAVPIVHIWYLRSIPSKLSYVLDIPTKELEKIIYYEDYVVINPGNSGLKRNDLIPESEYLRLTKEFGPGGRILDEEEEEQYFYADTGGKAILELLKRTDVTGTIKHLRKVVRTATTVQVKTAALKRLRILKVFQPPDEKAPLNKPEWMVLTAIPVIPPELRPLVPLEGGRFAASDLNDLYRRVIIRNNRLKQLIEIKAPDVILRNEKRMLQEAVDSLFDNSRRHTAVRSGTRRPLKSLSDMLKGKQGRFRQNLLGKRVDYSGRSVIVVGPELKLHECGLPKEMAIELFKPHIMRELIRRGAAKTPKAAKNMVESKDNKVYEVLDYVVRDHPVLLNRAPTLHRLGIQAFQPKLINGRAIQIHPLVCAAFNADFDGDQMAVHVPLSFEAQIEARLIMLSSHNILHPAHGAPIAIPSQDMVLGIYYLTGMKRGELGEGMFFASPDEAIHAYENGKISLHAIVKIRVGNYVHETNVGRAILYQNLPPGMDFVNVQITKKNLEKLVGECFKLVGNYETVKFLDRLKKIGFEYATKGGISISIADILIPEEKDSILEKAYNQVEDVQKKAEREILTENERYNKIIDTWTHTTGRVAEAMFEKMRQDQQGFNPVFMMADSGARGSKDQIKQLAGMRGLMAKPQKSMTGQAGEIIESPITANFKEGLTVQEYFISTHGARKGLADTALKTADAGYLTRRLVDVAQDVTIIEQDCGTIKGIDITPLKEGEDIIEDISDRILGRVAADDIEHPQTEEIIVEAGEEIDEISARKISEAGIDKVRIRSVLTCESHRGVCAKCYGRNLATGKMVSTGEAVGIMAAQSIGEPGTQLTLRTFHIGGTASRLVEKSEIVSKFDGIARFSDNLSYIHDEENGHYVSMVRHGKIEILDKNNKVLTTVNVPYGGAILVENNQKVKKGQIIVKWEPFIDVILAPIEGKVRFIDIIPELTLSEEPDERGHKQPTIIEDKERKLIPKIEIIGNNGEESTSLKIPVDAILTVEDGQNVKAGTILVKIPKSIGKTKDITGGLPRVAELFEARSPQNPAVVTEITGKVIEGPTRKGVNTIYVEASDGERREYTIPYGKHVLVRNGDFVYAGDRLCDGAVNPRDILSILGTQRVQEYLVNEIQEVYRLQNVRINDKHIEVIVRQMMRKIRVVDPGDTDFLEGDKVDIWEFEEENNRILDMEVVVKPGDSGLEVDEVYSKTKLAEIRKQIEENGGEQPVTRPAQTATFEPILLGITRAALNTESWISAASFQETTRVLTDAAVSAKEDKLVGLKENVTMGRLIPAGTGTSKYRDLLVITPKEEEEELKMLIQKQESFREGDNEE